MNWREHDRPNKQQAYLKEEEGVSNVKGHSIPRDFSHVNIMLAELAKKRQSRFSMLREKKLQNCYKETFSGAIHADFIADFTFFGGRD